MTEMMSRDVAKVYEFPKGGRAGSKKSLGKNSGKSAIECEVTSLPTVSIAWDNWYHDAAIAGDDHLGRH